MSIADFFGGLILVVFVSIQLSVLIWCIMDVTKWLVNRKKNRIDMKAMKDHIGDFNKMVTAVEWLFNQLWETPKDKLNWYSLLKQAKQMEKEQIVKSFDDGCKDVNRIGREYYQDTYESNTGI